MELTKKQIDDEFIEKERKKQLATFKKNKELNSDFKNKIINEIKNIYEENKNIRFKDLLDIFTKKNILNQKKEKWSYQELLYFLNKNQSKINIEFKKRKINKGILFRIEELKKQNKSNREISEILNKEDNEKNREWTGDRVRSYYNQNNPNKEKIIKKSKMKELEERIEILEKMLKLEKNNCGELKENSKE